MGSVRRQLILLWLTASPALADVCATVRPAWAAADGRASAVTELVQFLLWGGGAFVVLGLVVGLYLRKSIILNAVMLVTLILAVPHLWPLDAMTRQLALAEGCVGPSSLVTLVLGVVWVAALAGTLLKPRAAR